MRRRSGVAGGHVVARAGEVLPEEEVGGAVVDRSAKGCESLQRDGGKRGIGSAKPALPIRQHEAHDVGTATADGSERMLSPAGERGGLTSPLC